MALRAGIAKMQELQCPVCFDPLEVREVAPCDECGALATEIEHFRAGKHSYREYEIFPPLRLTLCNFCDVDFGSFDPAFFGLPPGAKIGYEYFRALEPVEQPTLARDKFCPSCGYRLKFLRFIADARRQHAR
jgi:hypothetical protein